MESIVNCINFAHVVYRVTEEEHIRKFQIQIYHWKQFSYRSIKHLHAFFVRFWTLRNEYFV